jgi:hypothetical protein
MEEIMMCKNILVTGLVIALMFSATGWATQLTVTDAQHFPAPGADDVDRGDDLATLLLDGDTGTFSYTTASFSINANGEQRIGFALDGLTEVNRIRIQKFYGILDHWYYYTTDTDAAMVDRTWLPVTGLTNGHEGAELITMNPTYAYVGGNQVIGEWHPDWYSLTFDAVNATGIALGFLTNTDAGSAGDLHLGISEAELYIPEPTTMGLLGLGSLALLRRRRKA